MTRRLLARTENKHHNNKWKIETMADAGFIKYESNETNEPKLAVDRFTTAKAH